MKLLLKSDKIYHLLVGFMISLFLSLFIESTWIVFSLLLTAGTLKEVLDCVRYGRFDKWDLVITILGGLLPLLTFSL